MWKKNNDEAIAERIVDFKEINRKPVEQVWVGEGDGRGRGKQ
ncbi:MAG: hypothetical protein Q8L37_03090 [Candidatus Gottesmanbacteria bacterium]|nr:hypothetical protein [Candidatus Gottesmanbacteria bacterium]